MRGVSRIDLAVAVGFVLAAVGEALVRFHDMLGLLVFNAAGALWLGSLAVRRSRPLVPICVIASAGVGGTMATARLWPDAPDGAGVWIFALMLAAYSLGAHSSGRAVVLGVLLPLVVVVSADLTTRSGWPRISGIVFVTAFVGLLPTAVGRMVRIRGERLRILRDQHEQIVRAQRAQQESAVLAERLRTVERLQPTLVLGLQDLAATSESAGDPGRIEASARDLLTRTREVVVALTAPVEDTPVPEIAEADHLAALRLAAQPWTVIAAGAVAAGLIVESRVLDLTEPGWVVVPAGLVVGAPLVLAWWRPVAAAALAWIAAAAYSRLLAPLDGSLSETAFAFAATFGVAMLSRRRTAVLGLAVCWLGQLVGVGTDDPLGAGAFLLLCWLGGLAVNEASRLVEQTRANIDLLGRQETASAARAVVEERLRLAREIHDAIGHSLTVVALQAGAARRLGRSDPGRAREVMRTVAAVARGGVASLALDGAGTDIVNLVERVRATGLTVDADTADETLLDPEQHVVAFRVIQEGLTNVLRHAPGSRATVAVHCRAGEVEIVVANSAPVGEGSGPGSERGLSGIRERVTAGAGEATWRRRDDGGFEVRALLPASPRSPDRVSAT